MIIVVQKDNHVSFFKAMSPANCEGTSKLCEVEECVKRLPCFCVLSCLSCDYLVLRCALVILLAFVVLFLWKVVLLPKCTFKQGV